MGQINSRGPEEGSERERCLVRRNSTTETRINYYIAPLNEDSCPLLDMSPDILERVCSFLKLSDISSLGQTCRDLNILVGEFLRHECCTMALVSSFREFVGKIQNLTTVRERRVIGDIERQNSLEEETVSRETLYKLLVNKRMIHSVVTRVSLCAPEVYVPHRGTGYIIITPDTDLARNILHVSSVCWLQLDHRFESVDPGTYSVSLLMKTGTDFRMPHRAEDYTEWTVSSPGDVETRQVNVKVYRDWWQKLRRGEIPQTASEDLVVKGEPNSDWLRVTVPRVVVRSKGDVCFQMKDVVCPYWKSGIYFDFLQLSKI